MVITLLDDALLRVFVQQCGVIPRVVIAVEGAVQVGGDSVQQLSQFSRVVTQHTAQLQLLGKHGRIVTALVQDTCISRVRYV